MQLHGLGVGRGKSQRRSDAARRTNGPEQIGVLITLIGRLPGARSAARPLPNEAVFPADARFVLHEGSTVNGVSACGPPSKIERVTSLSSPGHSVSQENAA
jgi:hypothetical protein